MDKVRPGSSSHPLCVVLGYKARSTVPVICVAIYLTAMKMRLAFSSRENETSNTNLSYQI